MDSVLEMRSALHDRISHLTERAEIKIMLRNVVETRIEVEMCSQDRSWEQYPNGPAKLARMKRDIVMHEMTVKRDLRHARSQQTKLVATSILKTMKQKFNTVLRRFSERMRENNGIPGHQV